MKLNEYISTVEGLEDIISNMPQKIKNRCAVIKKKESTILFCRKDPIEGVFILCEGKVKIMNIFSKGNVFIIGEGEQNSFIGEQAVIAGKKFAAVTVETVTNCTFIRIPRDAFLDWVHSDPKIALHLLEVLAKRLYPISKDMGSHSVLGCSELLKRYFIQSYKDGTSRKVKIDDKRQNIADKVGFSLRSVERSINQLKKDGYLSIEKRKIFINNEQYKKLLNAIKKAS